MRQLSFGGPEVRDGVCLQQQEAFSVEMHESLIKTDEEEEEGKFQILRVARLSCAQISCPGKYVLENKLKSRYKRQFM
jgi:hypothetical protein